MSQSSRLMQALQLSLEVQGGFTQRFSPVNLETLYKGALFHYPHFSDGKTEVLINTIAAGYLARPGSWSVCHPPGLLQAGLSASYTAYVVNVLSGCTAGEGAGFCQLEFLPAVSRQMCNNSLDCLFFASCKAQLLTHRPGLSWVETRTQESETNPTLRAASTLMSGAGKPDVTPWETSLSYKGAFSAEGWVSCIGEAKSTFRDVHEIENLIIQKTIICLISVH